MEVKVSVHVFAQWHWHACEELIIAAWLLQTTHCLTWATSLGLEFAPLTSLPVPLPDLGKKKGKKKKEKKKLFHFKWDLKPRFHRKRGKRNTAIWTDIVLVCFPNLIVYFWCFEECHLVSFSAWIVLVFELNRNRCVVAVRGEREKGERERGLKMEGVGLCTG